MQTTSPSYLKGAVLHQGQYREAMPALLKAGLTPASPSFVMDRRNEHADAEHELWSDYFDTDFGLASDSNRVYFAPHSKALRKLTPETRLTANGVQIRSTSGLQPIKRKDMILGRPLTEKEARQHQGWLALADGNQERLDVYVGNAFKLGKDKFGYNEMMRFYVPDDSKPILRAVVLVRLYYRSIANGSRYLDNIYARLLGVRDVSGEAANSQKSDDLASRVLKEMQAGKPVVQVANHVYLLAPKGIEVKK
jgi:hypothetical protein